MNKLLQIKDELIKALIEERTTPFQSRKDELNATIASLTSQIADAEKEEEFCSCGNPSKQGNVHFEGDEKLIYTCVDCGKERNFNMEDDTEDVEKEEKAIHNDFYKEFGYQPTLSNGFRYEGVLWLLKKLKPQPEQSVVKENLTTQPEQSSMPDAEEILTKFCKENKVYLTSNEWHTILEAMEEYATLKLKAQSGQGKEIPAAYEFHNAKTGHCYVDYVHRTDLEQDGEYSQVPLYYSNNPLHSGVQKPSDEDVMVYFNNHSNCYADTGNKAVVPAMTRSEVLVLAKWMRERLNQTNKQ